MFKRCNTCEQILPIDLFHRRTNRGKLGFQGKCKSCSYAYHKSWVSRTGYVDAGRKYTKEQHRMRERSRSARLNNTFVKRALCDGTTLRYAQIPMELVELKRAQLFLVRACRKESYK